jgi:hypothetical protein
MLTSEARVLGGNLLQQSSAGSELDLEPKWKFGPVANATLSTMTMIAIGSRCSKNVQTYHWRDNVDGVEIHPVVYGCIRNIKMLNGCVVCPCANWEYLVVRQSQLVGARILFRCQTISIGCNQCMDYLVSWFEYSGGSCNECTVRVVD